MVDAALEGLLPLLGEDARVLDLPRIAGQDGDVDIAVSRLDPLFGLRLSDGWRLCQCLRHDVRCWYWVLERSGQLLALDTLDDPRGLGRDGFRTGLAFTEPPEAARAAYLLAKRVRKADWSAEAWREIGELARGAPDSFRALAGDPGLAESALRGEPPEAAARRRARRARLLRRLRPRIAFLAAGRVLERLARPTGLWVVVAGPDGTGKSSLTAELPGACGHLFRRSRRLHWRPAVLPRPGAILRRPENDPARPHEHPPHGRLLSSALLVYYWLDFLLGSLIRVKGFRTRSGLVLMERGWWDLLVDPTRYRLDPPPRLTRLLGALLPSPDLLLLLEAPVATLSERQDELPTQEVARQSRRWREVPAVSARIDASMSASEVLAAAREEIVQALHERALARAGAGWVSFSSGRWLLPRGPRCAARAALGVYQPVTLRSRVGWELARALAGLGGFRLLPRGPAPPAAVREGLAPLLAPHAVQAVACGNAAGRWTALVVGDEGEPQFVAKLATTEEGRRALEREWSAIARLGPLLQPPLTAPRPLQRREALLVLEYVAWRPRLRPWRLDPDVARALGAMQAAAGEAHGDCTPWNLLATREGWTLVDWEESGPAPPFHDPLLYFIRSHGHLGRPSLRVVLAALRGAGWAGAALRAYAEAAGVELADASAALGSLAPDEKDDPRTRRAMASVLER